MISSDALDMLAEDGAYAARNEDTGEFVIRRPGKPAQLLPLVILDDLVAAGFLESEGVERRLTAAGRKQARDGSQGG